MVEFRAYQEEARYFKYAFNAAGKVVEEAPLIVTENGIVSRAMDASHIAMAVLEMPWEMFDEYEPPSDELMYGLDMEEVTRIVRRARVTDEITLEGEDEDEVIIKLGSSGYEREFRLRSIDVDDIPDEPELDFAVEVTVVPDFIQDAVRDADLVSDTVKVGAKGNTFYFKAEGERGRVIPKVQEGAEALLTFEVEENVETAYPLDYLKDMIQAAQGAESVRIRLGQDMPLELTFRIGPAGEGKLTFYLAPRVEE